MKVAGIKSQVGGPAAGGFALRIITSCNHDVLVNKLKSYSDVKSEGLNDFTKIKIWLDAKTKWTLPSRRRGLRFVFSRPSLRRWV